MQQAKTESYTLAGQRGDSTADQTESYTLTNQKEFARTIVDWYTTAQLAGNMNGV
jgi:hypothetical protein